MAKESKKPANTAFKQQRLKSWQPLLTPKSVIPSFFIIGLLFVPLGAVLYLASQRVVEVMFDYTNCDTLATASFTAPADSRRNIKEWTYDSASKICRIRFEVVEEIAAPVYIYYRLTNFYQNNRKFVKSFDLRQLKGEAVDKPAAECSPLDRASASIPVVVNGTTVQSEPNAIYYPCGLIANALFSDNIGNISCVSTNFEFANNGCKPGGTNVTYQFSQSGIAWPLDSHKYKESAYKTMANLTTKVIPPPFWREAFPEYKDGYTAENLPNLERDERFQVWMRTAGLPTFRKLWGVNSGNKLPTGIWEIPISQSMNSLMLGFEVGRFGGTKSIVISTTSVLGGKNNFLGGAYLVVGALCIVLGLAFLIRNWTNPRKLGDHKLLSWNQEQGRKSKNDQNLLNT